MERLTIRMPKQTLEEIGDQVDAGRYPSQSEFIRTAVREYLDDQRTSQDASESRSRSSRDEWVPAKVNQ